MFRIYKNTLLKNTIVFKNIQNPDVNNLQKVIYLNNIILYSFDLFIFKPKLLKENIFNKWINNTKSPEEHVNFLFNHYKKLEARNIIEAKIDALDHKMDKNGFTPNDLDEMRWLKNVRELIIKRQS